MKDPNNPNVTGSDSIPPRKPRKKPRIIKVAELTPEELKAAWDDSHYVPPTGGTAWERAQKIVIAYCVHEGPTIDRARYTIEYAYKVARRIARPLAALAAEIPLTDRELTSDAFPIYDALRSWASPDDEAVQVIATFFAAYANPAKNVEYKRVKL